LIGALIFLDFLDTLSISQHFRIFKKSCHLVRLFHVQYFQVLVCLTVYTAR